MYIQFLFLLALYVSATLCKTVLFKVISFGNDNQVQIVGGEKYILKPYYDDPLLYGGLVESAPDEEIKYYYIVDGVKEEFERILPADVNITYNDFFGRKNTIEILNTFKHPESLTTWDRSTGNTNLFDDSYIPTVHFTGETTEFFFHNPSPDYLNLENVTFYLKDTKYSFNNITATTKNFEFSKFQIKMILPNGGIDGRTVLKLRNGGEDPLNLRQYIYGKMTQAIGVPTIRSIMVRVYYNKKPAGFYTLQDQAYSSDFIRTEFYGNPETGEINAPEKIGNPINGKFGADFGYYPENNTYYQYFEGNKEKLLPLCKAIEELDPTNKDQLVEFEDKWLDLDTFHKSMAMEYLTGDWDGYWFLTSNFAVYDDPLQSTETTFKHYFISQDHDETFGVGLVAPINTVGDDFPSQSYTTILNREWSLSEKDPEHRILVDKFISGSPALQYRFQNTLIAIVETIFNPVAFREVVESYRLRYTPEMEWDFSFPYPHDAGKVSGVPIYNFDHFLKNFEEGVGGLHWGIYQWVEQRAEALKQEFCITWEGDQNPPSESCVPK